MFLKDYQKMIATTQSKHKGVVKYPQLLAVCKPGETGYVIRKGSKAILINVLEIKPRETKSALIIDEKVRAAMKDEGKMLEDAMGVFPFTAVVMESDSDAFNPGDIVQYDPEQLDSRSTKTLVIKQALAMLVTEYTLLGTVDTL